MTPVTYDGAVRSRRTVLAGVLGAGLATLPGCAAARGDTAPGRLVIAVAGHFVEQMKQVASAYGRIRPGIAVEVQSIPDNQGAWTQRLVTARLGGQLPDIVENVDVLINQLAEARVTADLRPWFERELGLTAEDFVPGFLGQYRPLERPAEVHGLPVSADATVLYYNADLFARARVDPPTDTWTWADMLAASKAITGVGNGAFYGMVMPDPWHAIYNPVLQLHGATVYDPDRNITEIGSPEAIPAWELMLRPYTDGTYASYAVGTSGGAAPTFEAGKVAMQIGVRLHAATFRAQLPDTDWDLVPMPLLDGERPVGGGSYGLSITTTSARKRAAWEFLVWFYRDDGGMKLLQETYQAIPPTRSGLETGAWRDLPGPPDNKAAYEEDVRAARLAPALPRRAHAVLDQSVVDATQQVVLEHRPVADAFEDAQRKVTEALETR